MTHDVLQAPLLVLRDGLTRLALAPSLGGAIASWRRLRDGLPLLRGGGDAIASDASPRTLAQYPLVPWSNRIGQGGYPTPQGWQALAPNTSHDPYPIHGSAWQQAWEVVSHGARHAHLRLACATPFAYVAEQYITLDEGCLDCRLVVTHHDQRPNWHGLGLHPYFPRNAATRLHAPATGVWQGQAGALPGALTPVPADWRFPQARALPATPVDHAFDGWDGTCVISQPDHGYALAGRATGCGLYLLYCPADRDFFCFEPVSHPIDAHHLPGHPGLRWLTSGQQAALRWQLRYRETPAHHTTGV